MIKNKNEDLKLKNANIQDKDEMNLITVKPDTIEQTMSPRFKQMNKSTILNLMDSAEILKQVIVKNSKNSKIEI